MSSDLPIINSMPYLLSKASHMTLGTDLTVSWMTFCLLNPFLSLALNLDKLVLPLSLFFKDES